MIYTRNKYNSVHKCVYTCVYVSVWELKTCIHSWVRERVLCGPRTCANTSSSSKWEITQLSCPVSITNKTITLTAEDWTGTAGHVVVWCASVLLLSLSSGCVISRVCMWAFSFLRVIHCVSVLSMPSECCVCAVVCGLILFFSPSIVFLCVAPYPRGPHLGKQTRTLQFRKVLPWKKYFFTVTVYCISIYVHVLMHQLNWQTP